MHELAITQSVVDMVVERTAGRRVGLVRLDVGALSGVVPDAMSEWNPEMAPQAIVMNKNGNSAPGMIGPPP